MSTEDTLVGIHREMHLKVPIKQLSIDEKLMYIIEMLESMPNSLVPAKRRAYNFITKDSEPL